MVRQFHEVLLDMVERLELRTEEDLRALEVLAKLAAEARTPNHTHIEIGGMFAQKKRQLKAVPSSERVRKLTALCIAVIDSLGKQEDGPTSA